MKHLKTFESFKTNEELNFMGFKDNQTLIKDIFSDVSMEKKALAGKFNDFAASLGDRKDVAANNAPSVAAFLNGKAEASTVTEEDIAKTVLKAKTVKKNDKGKWEDVGAYGGPDSGTGAEGAYKGN